jgi:hypothetical protein
MSNSTKTELAPLSFSVSLKGGTVELEFSRSIEWVGLPSTAAREMAKSLMAAADRADGVPEPAGSPLIVLPN